MEPSDQFSIGYYIQAVTGLLGRPRRFFGDLPGDLGIYKPLGVLLVSSLVFVGASLISLMPSRPIVVGSILLVNAVGMALIGAVVGFGTATFVIGRRVAFSRFFGIYALSSGVTLLAAWVPFFLWLTEPWRWWLIGTGMMNACGFRLSQTLLIIGLSVLVIFLLFWSVMPLLSPPGG